LSRNTLAAAALALCAFGAFAQGHVAYLGGVYEHAFERALGRVLVVSRYLDDVLAPDDEVVLTLGVHGVSAFGSPG
jgi:hypothetical protein